MKKEAQTSTKSKNNNDFIADISSMLVDNELPALGTEKFNDICSDFFWWEI